MSRVLDYTLKENVIRFIAIVIIATLFYFLGEFLDRLPNTKENKKWLRIAKKFAFLMMFIPLGIGIVMKETNGTDMSDSYSLFAFFSTPMFIYLNFTIKKRLKEFDKL